MYIPGRRRTASSPSSTVIDFALYGEDPLAMTSSFHPEETAGIEKSVGGTLCLGKICFGSGSDDEGYAHVCARSRALTSSQLDPALGLSL
jgi:hypothetical protein